ENSETYDKHKDRKDHRVKTHISRREFIGTTSALTLGGFGVPALLAQSQDLLLTNGRIHTMDGARRVVSQVLVRNGRSEDAGDRLSARGARRVDLKGRTVIPGIIDAHNHIVLVGNRPGWHTPLEHVFSVADVVTALQARSATVPRGEFITTVGP